MNKRAIWVIIGLMTAAVIGVVWLQVDLIRTAIRINEERFDRNVQSALAEVVKYLEYEEVKTEVYSSVNGFQMNYPLQDVLPGGRFGTGQSSLSLGSLATDRALRSQERKQLFDRLITNPRLAALYGRTAWSRPLEERIPLGFLANVLRQELSNRGIQTAFNYGVFSAEKRSFVIANGHYTVEDPDPNSVIPGYRNIYTSQYKVNLFPDEDPTPGWLAVHFPNRTNIIWSSLWKNFLGTLFFTLLILFCFAYTLHVIFRQKKVSMMKTDFINNMTHEFKTPIATISLAADSIGSPMIAHQANKVQRFAHIIKQENARMNAQVEKVLQMALIDKRDFSLNLSEVNLHEIIEDAVENINLQVEKKNGKAKAHLRAKQPIVEGDLTHISNIMNNLLDNANKYSPDKPEISVHTRNVSRGVEVIVKDRGVGMSKEVRKHIFDKFYRVHTGNLHDVKGFGLGLSYVKAMMTAHKGQIDVKSELGKGSSFVLFFPFRVQQN